MFVTKKVIFLLGSGISIPAELPSTNDITQLVLSCKGVVRHTDGTYYLSNNESEYFITNEYISRIGPFLERIKKEIDAYYRNSQKANYEDLYYLVSQIRDSEDGEYDNPAIKPLIDKIYPDIKSLFDRRESDTHYDWTLLDIAQEAVNYIRDVVWRSLSKTPKRLDHFRLISDVCHDKNISGIDIFTLNHDTLLEQYLSEANIQINDGFGPLQENGLRYWDANLLDTNDLEVRFLKLHGSINWFGFAPNHEMSLEKVAIPSDWDVWHTNDLNGQRQWPVGGRPLFLAGTFNKMLDYSSDIYAEQHFQFHKSLRETKFLIACGYGFRDKGVNRKIVEWVYSGDQNKLLIIHPEPDKLVINARGAISGNWGKWVKGNRVIVVPKKIEDVNGNEVLDYVK